MEPAFCVLKGGRVLSITETFNPRVGCGARQPLVIYGEENRRYPLSCEPDGACQVNGVEAAQSVGLSQLSGEPADVIGEGDAGESFPVLIEAGNTSPVPRCRRGFTPQARECCVSALRAHVHLRC